MSELPEVRRADCGHGFIPIEVPPAARHQNGNHEQPVYLCDDCRERFNRPKVETKALSDVQFTAQKDIPAMRASMEEAARRMNAGVADATSLGVLDAREGKTEEDCPYPDKRTREAKEWLRGFREARSAGSAQRA